MDRIAIGDGIGQSLQDHDAYAAAANGPLCFFIKSPAVAVGGKDASILVKIALLLRQPYRNAARHCQITFTAKQALAGEVNSDQRSRTGSLNCITWPLEIQLIRNLSSQVVPVITDGRLECANRFEQLAIR